MEPNPNEVVNQSAPISTPPPVINQHSQTKKSHKLLFFILGILIVLVLVGGIAGGYFLGTNSSRNDVTQAPITTSSQPSENTTPTPTTEPELTADQALTADWKTYTDSDFKISFKYPSDYGNVIVAPGPEGKLMKFTNNKSLMFGAYIKPVTEADRGVTVFDFSGYSEKNGKYYFKDWTSNSEEEIIPIKIFNSGGRKILILNNNSFTVSKNAYDGYGKIGNKATIALINTNTNKYSGIVFNNGVDQTQSIPEEDFEKIISTIKFTN